MYDQAAAAPPELEEVRCPQCGGLNRAGAEWCGQCLERFVPPKPLEIPGARAGGGPPPPPPPPPGSVQPQALPSELSQTESSTVPGHSEAPLQNESNPNMTAMSPQSPADGKAFLVGTDGIRWACKKCETVNSIETDVCSVCGMSFADLLRPPAPDKPKRDPNTVALISLFWPGAGHGYIGQWGQAIARGVMSFLMLAVTAVSFAQGGAGGMATIFGGIAFSFWAVAAHDSFQEASNAPNKVILRPKYFLWFVLGVLMLMVGSILVQGLEASAAGT
jgi:hypothetical protein